VNSKIPRPPRVAVGVARVTRFFVENFVGTHAPLDPVDQNYQRVRSTARARITG
jgi:hypothetical protein